MQFYIGSRLLLLLWLRKAAFRSEEDILFMHCATSLALAPILTVLLLVLMYFSHGLLALYDVFLRGR
jgi:hypothetical protein